MAAFSLGFDVEQTVKQAVRDVIILEFGGIWEQYAFENNIPEEIYIGFLDYLNKKIDKSFESI